MSTSFARESKGMVHSVSGWTRSVQVKLWDPLRTRAIPENLGGAITTRRYTNSRLPLPLPSCFARVLYCQPTSHSRSGPVAPVKSTSVGGWSRTKIWFIHFSYPCLKFYRGGKKSRNFASIFDPTRSKRSGFDTKQYVWNLTKQTAPLTGLYPL